MEVHQNILAHLVLHAEDFVIEILVVGGALDFVARGEITLS